MLDKKTRLGGFFLSPSTGFFLYGSSYNARCYEAVPLGAVE
jgi:hypothetical protein